MSDFKLLRGVEELIPIEPLPDELASWMWTEEFGLRPVPNHDWVMRTERCYGIRTFLSLFPERYIIPVDSITGNNIRHSFQNRNRGWGFDITSELLTIDYYILIPNTNL